MIQCSKEKICLPQKTSPYILMQQSVVCHCIQSVTYPKTAQYDRGKVSHAKEILCYAVQFQKHYLFKIMQLLHCVLGNLIMERDNILGGAIIDSNHSFIHIGIYMPGLNKCKSYNLSARIEPRGYSLPFYTGGGVRVNI